MVGSMVSVIAPLEGSSPASFTLSLLPVASQM